MLYSYEKDAPFDRAIGCGRPIAIINKRQAL